MVMLEDVRDMKPIGSWCKPPSRSTLMRMTKDELIEYIAVGYKNWHIGEEMISRSAEYHKREIKLT